MARIHVIVRPGLGRGVMFGGCYAIEEVKVLVKGDMSTGR
jgi:hypothetical protein